MLCHNNPNVFSMTQLLSISSRRLHYLKSIGLFAPKIYHFSNGAASQYKNQKNFINLCHHKDDFGILAEWHFSATSHGKGACDRVGGTVKRLAASVVFRGQQIMTSHQLFEWETDNIPGVVFGYGSWKFTTMKKPFWKNGSSNHRQFQVHGRSTHLLLFPSQ